MLNMINRIQSKSDFICGVCAVLFGFCFTMFGWSSFRFFVSLMKMTYEKM